MLWTKQEVEYLKKNFPYESDLGLSRQLNKSPNAIRIKAGRLNIKKYSTIYRENLKLNEVEEQVIIGGLLGDLHCRINKSSNNATLEGGHSKKQKEYMDYKIYLLKRFKWNIRSSKQGIYLYQSRSYRCLNKYYEMFYQFRKKKINKSILDKINKFGLLIWYMDDGSYSKRDKISRLYTNCFSYQEQIIIKNWFENKWNMHPRIHEVRDVKNRPGVLWHCLSFPVRETIRLHNLFEGYFIPECMKYKFSFYN